MVTVEEARRQLQEMTRELDLLNIKYSNVKQFESSLTHINSMVSQLTGTRQLSYAMNMFHRARMTVREFNNALELLSKAYIAGGPMAWLVAIIAFGTVTLSVTDMAMDLGSR